MLNLREYCNFSSKQTDLYDTPFDHFIDEHSLFKDMDDLEEDKPQNFGFFTKASQLVNERTTTEQIPEIEPEVSTEMSIQELERLVQEEIQIKGIESVVADCANHCFLGKKTDPKPSKSGKYIRDRHDKTEAQVKAMVGALEPGQTQLPRWKRVRLGRKIGLSESQIYKWYYDTYKTQ